MKRHSFQKRRENLNTLKVENAKLKQQVAQLTAILQYHEKIIIKNHNRQVAWENIKLFFRSIWPFNSKVREEQKKGKVGDKQEDLVKNEPIAET